MLSLYLLIRIVNILAYISSESDTRKHEKLPNIVIHACKNITKKWLFWKSVARKFGFVCLCFDQLRWNSSIVWLQSIRSVASGAKGNTPDWGCKSLRVQFLALVRIFMLSFLFVVFLIYLSKNNIIYRKLCNFFCNVNTYWPIIRVSRYSVFNITYILPGQWNGVNHKGVLLEAIWHFPSILLDLQYICENYQEWATVGFIAFIRY